MMELVILAELIKILESAHLTSIISKHLVEEKVAILESAHMDGYHRDTSPEQIVIREQQFCCYRYGRDEYISISGEGTFIIHDLKVHVVEILQPFDKTFRLILIAKKTEGYLPIAIICSYTQPHGTADIAKPHN